MIEEVVFYAVSEQMPRYDARGVPFVWRTSFCGQAVAVIHPNSVADLEEAAAYASDGKSQIVMRLLTDFVLAPSAWPFYPKTCAATWN